MQLLEIKHNGTALRFIDDRRRTSETDTSSLKNKNINTKIKLYIERHCLGVFGPQQ